MSVLLDLWGLIIGIIAVLSYLVTLVRSFYIASEFAGGCGNSTCRMIESKVYLWLAYTEMTSEIKLCPIIKFAQHTQQIFNINAS